MRSSAAIALLLLAAPACGGGGSGDDDGADPDARTGADAEDGVDAAGGCPRDAGPDDRARFVVVAHPYDAAGDPADAWEVLDLSPTGALTRPATPRTFTMGRATIGEVVFTPDGEVGLVAQDNGTVGVVRLDAAGAPTVVHDAFEGDFYASGITVDPRGDRAWIVDGNWRNNGGGIYEVGIGCDGTLEPRGLVAPSKLAGAFTFRTPTTVVAGATDIMTSAAGHDVHLLAWGATPTVTAGVDAFADDEHIIGGAALTGDGGTFLLGDTSQFSGVPNRVAVIGVTDAALTRVTVLSPIEDPQAIAASPFADEAIVASAFGDAIFVLDRGGAGGAWRIAGEVDYTGADPQLPGDVAMITRGTLRGHVLVSELASVRHLAFGAGGGVDDLGSLAFGDGLEAIGGAIGVTP